MTHIIVIDNNEYKIFGTVRRQPKDIHTIIWMAGELDSNILSKYSNVRKLDCKSNNITNLDALFVLEKLEDLDCSDNNITNIKGVIYCSKLKKFTCDNNPIDNLNDLSKCFNLTYVSAHNCMINRSRL